MQPETISISIITLLINNTVIVWPKKMMKYTAKAVKLKLYILDKFHHKYFRKNIPKELHHQLDLSNWESNKKYNLWTVYRKN